MKLNSTNQPGLQRLQQLPKQTVQYFKQPDYRITGDGQPQMRRVKLVKAGLIATLSAGLLGLSQAIKQPVVGTAGILGLGGAALYTAVGPKKSKPSP